MCVVAVLLLLQLCHLAVAHPFSHSHHPAHRMNTSLPGQPHVEFHQFSGYVTIDEKNKRALFFYFAEAEKDAVSKPLVLWLNGGGGP